MDSTWLHSPNNYLIYFGDVMCSWCYGFAENLTLLKNNNPQLPLKVVNGGLRPGGTHKNGDVMPEFGHQKMSEFLRHHWEEVNKRSGQPFTYSILEDEDFVYDTEPASRACVVARNMNPKIQFDFFKGAQAAFYVQNKDTNKIETYLPIAEKLGLDLNDFTSKFNSDEMKAETMADFQLSANMGVRGFPSLVLKKDQEFFLIANGYQEVEPIQAIIDKIMGDKMKD